MKSGTPGRPAPPVHPSNLALEAFAADESDDDVADHLADCVLCRNYVVELVIAAYAAQAWQEAAGPGGTWETS